MGGFKFNFCSIQSELCHDWCQMMQSGESFFDACTTLYSNME